MTNLDIIELEVFKIRHDQIVKFADIKIKNREIIWMNINIKTFGARPVYVFPAHDYIQKLDIKNISKNLIKDFNNKISHKINLLDPYDRENTYIFITNNRLIELGIIEKPKRINIKLNDNKRFFIGIFIAILIAIIGWIIALYN